MLPWIKNTGGALPQFWYVAIRMPASVRYRDSILLSLDYSAPLGASPNSRRSRNIASVPNRTQFSGMRSFLL